MNTIYLDNAATSFPKPEGVAEAMVRFGNLFTANICIIVCSNYITVIECYLNGIKCRLDIL